MAVLILVFSSPAAADWQTWVGLGGGRGGAYRDGAVVSGDLGFRHDRTSAVFTLMTSVSSYAPNDLVGEAGLLLGRELTRGRLQVEVQVGPSVISQFGATTPGLLLGAHVAYSFSRVLGVAARPVLSMNRYQNHSALIVQIQLGKLR